MHDTGGKLPGVASATAWLGLLLWGHGGTCCAVDTPQVAAPPSPAAKTGAGKLFP